MLVGSIGSHVPDYASSAEIIFSKFSNLSGAKLVGAKLNWVDKFLAKLMGAKMADTKLIEARLIEARQKRSDLSWAYLRNADLADDRPAVNLSKADVLWRILLGEKLVGTDLSGAKYDKQTKWPEDFDPQVTGAILES